MELIDGILMLFVATLFQLPFHLIFSSPWLFLAFGVALYLKRSGASSRTRAALCAVLISIGISPVYGFHGSMMPAYLVVGGNPHYVIPAMISFAITGLLTYFVLLRLFRRNVKRDPIVAIQAGTTPLHSPARSSDDPPR